MQNNKCTSTGLSLGVGEAIVSVLDTICLTGQDASRRPPVMQVLEYPFMDIYIQRASWSPNTSTTGITTVPLKRNSVTPISLKKGNGSHPFDRGDHYMREVNIRKGRYDLDLLDSLGGYTFKAKDSIAPMLQTEPKNRPNAKEIL
ncbi:uncharacterized protein FMAN_02159 [Fusarium mangiferae]|uniref:Protein kinase domain-containing protein n=1 Tax=Fusarium mangiferae TaxID=192010 RepID=A0A1L7TVB8_FUSMA|nr:uncharacterized protein FMAN_02159 [Fusarium mangiferae]CVK99307.1 uncharacterized protein FMAN_02159 [Fusarium mangiferae]